VSFSAEVVTVGIVELSELGNYVVNLRVQICYWLQIYPLYASSRYEL
jgi:hypothetical protein